MDFEQGHASRGGLGVQALGGGEGMADPAPTAQNAAGRPPHTMARGNAAGMALQNIATL